MSIDLCNNVSMTFDSSISSPFSINTTSITILIIHMLNREWLLTKIVNGERASYSAPKFARMQERTRSQMLEDIVANLANHAETGQIPKPYRRGSWRPIGEDPCMLRVTISCCLRLYVAHSMYFASVFFLCYP